MTLHLISTPSSNAASTGYQVLCQVWGINKILPVKEGSVFPDPVHGVAYQTLKPCKGGHEDIPASFYFNNNFKQNLFIGEFTSQLPKLN